MVSEADERGGLVIKNADGDLESLNYSVTLTAVTPKITMMSGVTSELCKAAKIVNVVLTYWVISISMVFFNKSLVGGADSGRPDASIFIAWAQSVVCVLFIILYSNVGALLSSSVKPQAVSWSLCLSRPVLLVSVLFSLMLSSNNYCLKLVGVAFFQIARSFTLIFTVLFSVWILRKRASCRVCSCCLVVVLGFLIGVDQEKAAGTLSVLGVVSGLTSSLFVALNGIYTKKALDLEGMDSVKLTLHINVNASLLLLIPSLLTGQVRSVLEEGRLFEPMFWGATGASGVLGFLIAWASTRQIQYTSPVTHHISNNTKSILQALLAVWIYQDYKSSLWWLGCLVVLLGAFLYTIVKMREENVANERVLVAVQVQRDSVCTPS